jgi:hypothetical protein
MRNNLLHCSGIAGLHPTADATPCSHIMMIIFSHDRPCVVLCNKDPHPISPSIFVVWELFQNCRTTFERTLDIIGLVKKRSDSTIQRVKEVLQFTTEGAGLFSSLIQTPFLCGPPSTLSTYTDYIMTPNTTCAVQDAILLLPKDYSLFIQWQKKQPKSELGKIHDALEYHLFIEHRDALISGEKSPPITYQSRMERSCGHTRHPSDKSTNELCPVCKVRAHLSFLDAITLARDRSGGSRLKPHSKHTISYKSGELKKVWHTARLQLQELIGMLDVMTTYEEAWEATHPAEAAAARETKCASVALKLAQEDCMYPADLSPPVERTKKQVSFSPNVQIKDSETISTAITKFTPDRPRYLFSRSSSSYEPGDHACPYDSEFIDTSQAIYSTAADIGNLKVYVTDDEEAFDELQTDPQYFKDSVGEFQGIVDLHNLGIKIHQYILDDMAQENIEGLLKKADRMMVLVDDEMRGVMDIYLFNGSD